jgi:hypothetical protein
MEGLPSFCRSPDSLFSQLGRANSLDLGKGGRVMQLPAPPALLPAGTNKLKHDSEQGMNFETENIPRSSNFIGSIKNNLANVIVQMLK